MIEIKKREILEFIVPRKLIFQNKMFEILKINSDYHIRGYTIKTCDDFIEEVIISGKHPNANPRTDEFCIPNFLRKYKITEESLKMINNILYCFNLDDCYFTPWNDITYKKLEG